VVTIRSTDLLVWFGDVDWRRDGKRWNGRTGHQIEVPYFTSGAARLSPLSRLPKHKHTFCFISFSLIPHHLQLETQQRSSYLSLAPTVVFNQFVKLENIHHALSTQLLHRNNLRPTPSSDAYFPSWISQTEKKQHDALIPPKVSFRRRQLSLSTNRNVVTVQTSALLTRLPLGICEMIYKEVLGNLRLHILSLPRRMGHMTCQFQFHDHRRLCFPPRSLIDPRVPYH